MSAALELLDQDLATWTTRLRHLDDNLIALESDATLQWLAHRKGDLTGVTLERGSRALDQITELFQARDKLAEVLAEATRRRAAISSLAFWDRDERIREVRELLVGASIDLGATETPLAERKLLEDASTEHRLTLADLVRWMTEAYANARDAVMAIGKAQQHVMVDLEILDREVKALREAATGHSSSEVDDALAEHAHLNKSMVNDPLGADLGLAKRALLRVAAARARLAEDAAAITRVTQLVRAARDLRAALQRGATEAAAAFAEAERALDASDGAVSRPVDGAQLRGLFEWQDKLEEVVRARRTGPAEVGLTRWIEAAEQEQARLEIARDRLLSDARSGEELAGRLSARRAQILALTSRGTTAPPSLDQALRDAERIVAQRPLPLLRARAAVEACEAEVQALARSPRR
jgi:hypothetical protein